MIGTREWAGYWWLPPDETNRLGGTLGVVDGEASLDVMGDFGHEELSRSATEVSFSVGPADRPRILGVTADGEQITLVDCTTGQWSSHSSGVAKTAYRPQIVIVGAWLAAEDEISFTEIAIRTNDLDTWASVSGFSERLSIEDVAETGQSTLAALEVHFEPPAPVTIPLDNGNEASVEFAWSRRAVDQPLREITVSQEAWLHLRFSKPRQLDDILISVGELRNFLSLAIGRPVSVLSVRALPDSGEDADEKKPTLVELLWAIPHNPEPAGRRRYAHEMLFTLETVRPRIPELLRAWFACQSLLEPVLNLYFGMRYHPQMYLDVRFLAHAQAVETYDRRRRPDATQLPPDEHETWLEAVIDSAPEEHRERLRDELAWSNALNLRRRIHDVANECTVVCNKITGKNRSERDKFIMAVVESRNYYTHYDPAAEAKAAKDGALLLLNVQLRAIIEMSLLRELGFTCEEIDEMFVRAERYAEVIHFKQVVADQTPTAGDDE